MKSSIAIDAAAVDREFLDGVLGGPHGHVVHAATERIGTGQEAVTVRAHLQWSRAGDDLPATVIVKVAPDAAGPTERERRSDTYAREVRFYHRLAGRVTCPTPRCRHAAHDPASGAFTIVLDDVDGTVGDQLRGCTAPEAEAMVRAAVGLHAPTWNDDSLAGLDWLHTSDRPSRQRRADRYRLLLPGFIARYAARLSPSVVEVARWLTDRIVETDDAVRLHGCLVHQDLRIDNMLFSGADGPDVTVLDWQTVGFGSGAADLAYALGSGLRSDERRVHEWRLVDSYAEGLALHGVAVDRADLHHDYRLGSATGMVMAVIASQSVGRTERGDELFAVLAERHALQMLDLRIDELIG